MYNSELHYYNYSEYHRLSLFEMIQRFNQDVEEKVKIIRPNSQIL